jgi:hypothetical protein
MHTLTTTLSAIPLWVYPLLFALTLLGRRAQKDRSSPVALIYALPLLGLLSLNRALDLGEVATTALLMGWSSGVFAGYILQPYWTLSRSGNRVELKGESVTMVTILALFTTNFAAGMAQGMAADLSASVAFCLVYGVFSGVLSGSLAGRALFIARMPVLRTV